MEKDYNNILVLDEELQKMCDTICKEAQDDYAIEHCSEICPLEIGSLTGCAPYVVRVLREMNIADIVQKWNNEHQDSNKQDVIEQGTCGDNATWELYDDGTLYIKGSGKMKDYNYKRTKTPWYSQAKNIKNIVIADGITSIGNTAFAHCKSLESITIPNSVTTIGMEAFSDCGSLKSITIPDSVTTIGGDAFSYCSSLASITIPSSGTAIGEYAFYECKELKTAGPIGGDYNIQFGWTDEIPDRAFYGCGSLESITIPDSVKSIGEDVFERCDKLPNEVKVAFIFLKRSK